MRVLYGRGDWPPLTRIQGLLRYAFIGDSHTYGAGVPPDQTLAANTERQLNELISAWPVECVNHGINGYNLWNSWTAFKRLPQIYDGLVLTLCNNDADFFCRSYRCSFSEPHETRWDPAHPFGRAIIRCFDEIAAFSREFSLPIAVVFSNTMAIPGQMRIGEIIGELCASRSFCFVDTLTIYRNRNLSREDLHVSTADFHPSAIAHNAVGRHLALALRNQGWFTGFEQGTIAEAPERILAAARSMVDNDRYPIDAALNWAQAAIQAKTALARRVRAMAAESSFDIVSARAQESFESSSREWHVSSRIQALAASTRADWGSIAPSLFSGEEERIKIEELTFVLESGDWSRIFALCRGKGTIPAEGSGDDISPVHNLEDTCLADLHQIRAELLELEILGPCPLLSTSHTRTSLQANLKHLLSLVDRSIAECSALIRAFGRAEKAFVQARPELSDADAAFACALLKTSQEHVIKLFPGFTQSWLKSLSNMRHGQPASYTTVEVTFSSRPSQTGGNQLLSTVLEYEVPSRLQFTDTATFLPGDLSTTVKVCFPTFFAGRVFLRPFAPGGGESQLDFTPIKAVLYNGNGRRLEIEANRFSSDTSGRFVSPAVFLF